jgi:hypothetical protein
MTERNMADMGAQKGQVSEDRTITREEWGQFCKNFTLQHEGWLVTVEEQDGNQRRVIAQDQPLQALSYQMDGDRLDVRVVIGRDSSENLAHVVKDAKSIHLQFDEQGAHERLRIRSPQGVTNVRFRSPALPDTVDGLP